MAGRRQAGWSSLLQEISPSLAEMYQEGALGPTKDERARVFKRWELEVRKQGLDPNSAEAKELRQELWKENAIKDLPAYKDPTFAAAVAVSQSSNIAHTETPSLWPQNPGLRTVKSRSIVEPSNTTTKDE